MRVVRAAGRTSRYLLYHTTKVRITVRAGEQVIMREGIGTGLGRAALPEAAHEMALKAAETDATKRALATFGNPFGLALYDKDQSGVTRPVVAAPLVLSRSEGKEVAFTTPGAFADAAFEAIRATTSVDDLYALWERNRKTLVQIKSAGPSRGRDVLADALVAAFKAKAQSLGRPPASLTFDVPSPRDEKRAGPLAFPKEKRLRNKEHLKFVAQLACLVCGRKPSHAHHVRYAQARALGLKVSDEFTVPLCSVHHDEIHRTGDEKSWWARHEIDPLKAAAELWASSQGRAASATEEAPSRHDGQSGAQAAHHGPYTAP